MTPLTNILVATDFSTHASRAVNRAAQLAQEHRATLHLLHVMDKLLLQMFTGSIDEHPLVTEQRLLDSARSRLRDPANHLASHFDVPVKDEVLIGRIHSQIVQYVMAHAVDLSVFGAHGENFVRDLFVGSTASKFLRKGHQPTLVVRSENNAAYQEVLVAVDFSPASRIAIEAAARIAPRAEIHVLHVSEMPLEGKMRFAGIKEDSLAQYHRKAEQDARAALDAFLGPIEGTAKMTRSVTSGRPGRTIVEQAQARRADFVVMGKRGQLEFDEFLPGSVTLRVLDEIACDLLLVAPAAA
ncbi:MAG: universal stress protein [Polaromonas sp.]|nr:universal stress protein [Polaromonas sp.]